MKCASLRAHKVSRQRSYCQQQPQQWKTDAFAYPNREAGRLGGAPPDSLQRANVSEHTDIHTYMYNIYIYAYIYYIIFA